MVERGLIESLLSFDPGATTGWAWFKKGRLQASGHFRFDAMKLNSIPFEPGTEVVVEKPQYRKDSPMTVDDCIELSIRAGTLSGLYTSQGCKVELVRPTTWKGSVPKEIHQRRIWALLDEEEQRRLSKNHNTVDAGGIGLWRLGRLNR